MTNTGFDETQRDYVVDRQDKLVGQIRRLGSAGPAYEVMRVDQDNNVHIEIIVSGEQVVFPLHDVLEDPMAETIP